MVFRMGNPVKIIAWIPVLPAAAMAFTAMGFAAAAGPVSGTIDSVDLVLPPVSITGVVTDELGPVAEATVRVTATAGWTRTDAAGRFTLAGPALDPGRIAGAAVVPNARPTAGVAPMSSAGVMLSAWKQDYYCALFRVEADVASPVAIQLVRYQTGDNPAYEWVPPRGESSCENCHPGVVELWARGAHSRSARNPRFLTMYNGTDVEGRRSPPTRRRIVRDYGTVPLSPDPSRPYYGPGFKLDYADIAGNCAACHIPGAALDAPYGIDPNLVTGADAQGIHCDFCHKIAAVSLDPATGCPHRNRPGVLSTAVRRPFLDAPDGRQLFFGNLDDPHAESGDAYLPLLSQSEFCAPCHSARFWNVPIYDSYDQWLASPYSDPVSGRTCQQCHMPSPSVLAGDTLSSLAPGHGGLEREPSAIHAHIDRGISDHDFLRDAISLRSEAWSEGNRFKVQATVRNEKAGHHYPTDSPLRHLLLVVEAADSMGRALQHLAGPTLPRWAGVGEAARGYLAGLPGQAYAKVLEESWTGVSPTAAYWNNVRLVSDNRLAALASDTTAYEFAAPTTGLARATVTLLLRPAYIELADWKGWEHGDIVLARETLEVRVQSSS